MKMSSLLHQIQDEEDLRAHDPVPCQQQLTLGRRKKSRLARHEPHPPKRLQTLRAQVFTYLQGRILVLVASG